MAIVTGATQGIGLGIARRLVGDGYAVLGVALDDEPSAAFAALGAEGDVRYVSADLADLTSHPRVTAALEVWGRVDVLVNNAGVSPRVREDLLQMTPESYDRVMDTNLRGTVFLTQAVARVMVEQGGPGPVGTPRPLSRCVINIGSANASMVSVDRGEYCLSKTGLTMATRLFAVRLAPEGVAVYEVRPGIIATDMTAVVKDKYDAYIHDDGQVPVARWGQPDDVAATVAVLASGALPYSTGDTIFADGGMHLRTL